MPLQTRQLQFVLFLVVAPRETGKQPAALVGGCADCAGAVYGSYCCIRGHRRMSFASVSSDSCCWAVLVFLVALHR
jgi:hypothetical protein